MKWNKLTTKEKEAILQSVAIQKGPLYTQVALLSKTGEEYYFKIMLEGTVYDTTGFKHKLVGTLRGSTLRFKRAYLISFMGKDERVKLLLKWIEETKEGK